jgi:copper chaperone
MMLDLPEVNIAIFAFPLGFLWEMPRSSLFHSLLRHPTGRRYAIWGHFKATTETHTMTKTIDFVVTGEDKLHCSGCEQRVGHALRRLVGVQDVRASAETQQVRVAFDPAQVSPEQVQSKLEQLGYEVAPQGGT